MSNMVNGLMGLDSAIGAITKALGSAFADIWCVAIFVLVDLASPYGVQFLNSVGLYQGVGSMVYQNFLLILKFTLCDNWKSQMKLMGLHM